MNIIPERCDRPLVVHLDCDGVLSDFVGHVCRELQSFGFRRTPESITHYTLTSVLGGDELYRAQNAMRRVGFVTTMPWYDGARDFLARLQRHVSVHVVTSPLLGAPMWMPERMAWLAPVIDSRKITFTAQKHLVRGDVLVEDNAHNAVEWLESNSRGQAFVVDRPWNRDADTHPRLKRVRTYSQIVDAILGGSL